VYLALVENKESILLFYMTPNGNDLHWNAHGLNFLSSKQKDYLTISNWEHWSFQIMALRVCIPWHRNQNEMSPLRLKTQYDFQWIQKKKLKKQKGYSCDFQRPWIKEEDYQLLENQFWIFNNVFFLSLLLPYCQE